MDDDAVAATVFKARQGDAVALTALLDHLTPYIARICGAIALDRGPDATQETLAIVFKRLHTLDEPAAIKAWTRTIAVREALRYAQNGRQVEPALPEQLPDPSAMFETSADVRAVLAQLPATHRAILVLRDLEGFSQAEAARQLGIAEGTAKSRLHRARTLFRRHWTHTP